MVYRGDINKQKLKFLRYNSPHFDETLTYYDMRPITTYNPFN